MRILVLSFYYEPDLCAGSFRCTALVEQLRKHENVSLEVITTLPNRYASFSASAPEHEVKDGVEIHRIALPSHKSGMIDQIKAFAAFYRKALKISRQKNYDLVFATSSRLFTAFLGARIAKKKKIPLYLDVRDIFVDTLKDVLTPKITWLVKPIFSAVESYSFKDAIRINLVSRGFEEYFVSRYPKVEYRWFTNGIDEEFLKIAPNLSIEADPTDVITVLYAGNIGEGQGLHTILPELSKHLKGRAKFRVIGDGGRKALLQATTQNMDNVELLPPVNRQQLIQEYQIADVLFLHLNDYPAFRKVLPSKIFEYAATGKPIWAGVAGYSADFLSKEVVNSAVFHPGADKEALDSFDSLNLSVHPRQGFIEKYARTTIMSKMAQDIACVAKQHE